MKPSEIKVGATYRGKSGETRTIEALFEVGHGTVIVTWTTPTGYKGSLPVRQFANWALAKKFADAMEEADEQAIR